MCIKLSELQNKHSESSKTTQHRILIVDDEEDVTFSLKRALEDYGFKVTTFNSPLLAVSHFTANAYDLLLLDIRMPEMGGFEFYRKIRKIDKSISVFFMTAFEEYYDEFKKASPTLVSTYFIRKPIEIDHLVNEMRSKISFPSPSSKS